MRAIRVKYLRKQCRSHLASCGFTLCNSHYRQFRKLYLGKGLDYALLHIDAVARTYNNRVRKAANKIKTHPYEHKNRNINYQPSSFIVKKKKSFFQWLMNIVKMITLYRNAKSI